MRLPVGLWGCVLVVLGSISGCTLITDIDRTKIPNPPVPDASAVGGEGGGAGSAEPTSDAAVDGSVDEPDASGGTGGSGPGPMTDSGTGGTSPGAEAGIPEAGLPDSGPDGSTSNPSTPDSGSDASVDAGDGG